ncbi:hypothetical protein [Bacillus cereus]|uniref:hypothetical protein n=1 Tax=Bacillus cereus TaxID=1396 RepID=UPI001F0FAD50|nr:hypothetical protein [Bacillus cereus]MCH5460854.1 hypothetical protein [Bacillus cereus]
MDSLLTLLHDAVKVFLTVFATACANELAKKLSNKKNKRTAPAGNELDPKSWTHI